ncbi:hypothetical protein PRIPAC_91918 [Pristionchus pacificus]|uniref:TGF_BETA_2 domain-containing protein n=1 Tax=Pristionchus pacificus TaxID=54126 RepID=A0A2A6BQN4_PRIPA|nr:hypothetical protein PRIPAC_91918 [Pristionchus pacificus]|eukprot:PDM68071.1 hypothetical protein PRIPAC_46115 [Pristionchus pacificus]
MIDKVLEKGAKRSPSSHLELEAMDIKEKEEEETKTRIEDEKAKKRTEDKKNKEKPETIHIFGQQDAERVKRGTRSNISPTSSYLPRSFAFPRKNVIEQSSAVYQFSRKARLRMVKKAAIHVHLRRLFPSSTPPVDVEAPLVTVEVREGKPNGEVGDLVGVTIATVPLKYSYTSVAIEPNIVYRWIIERTENVTLHVRANMYGQNLAVMPGDTDDDRKLPILAVTMDPEDFNDPKRDMCGPDEKGCCLRQLKINYNDLKPLMRNSDFEVFGGTTLHVGMCAGDCSLSATETKWGEGVEGETFRARALNYTGVCCHPASYRDHDIMLVNSTYHVKNDRFHSAIENHVGAVLATQLNDKEEIQQNEILKRIKKEIGQPPANFIRTEEIIRKEEQLKKMLGLREGMKPAKAEFVRANGTRNFNQGQIDNVFVFSDTLSKRIVKKATLNVALRRPVVDPPLHNSVRYKPNMARVDIHERNPSGKGGRRVATRLVNVPLDTTVVVVTVDANVAYTWLQRGNVSLYVIANSAGDNLAVTPDNKPLKGTMALEMKVTQIPRESRGIYDNSDGNCKKPTRERGTELCCKIPGKVINFWDMGWYHVFAPERYSTKLCSGKCGNTVRQMHYGVYLEAATNDEAACCHPFGRVAYRTVSNLLYTGTNLAIVSTKSFWMRRSHRALADEKRRPSEHPESLTREERYGLYKSLRYPAFHTTMNTMNILLLPLFLCIGVQAKKRNFNCSIFSMKFIDGKRIDIKQSSWQTCGASCRTVLKRDETDGPLKISGACGVLDFMHDTNGCMGNPHDSAIHCDCSADNCNFPFSDENAAKFEGEYIVKSKIKSDTTACKEFELVYNWKEDERKIVSFVKNASDVLCTGANCHTWIEEKGQWETTISGGCGKLSGPAPKCEKIGITHVECVCAGVNCNVISDAVTAQSYHDEWSDHFPPGPYPRSGKE